jgi:hypothetical protein
MCTEEFRMYLLVVVDTLGNPVDSLHTSIKNEQGKEYDFMEFEPPPYLQGANTSLKPINAFVMFTGLPDLTHSC